MDIISDSAKDVRTTGHVPGGYEWWYFDGISADERYSFVVILYEGNPFSPRYIKALEKRDENATMPSYFPAISLSVYEQKRPVYYSFTEYGKQECFFSEDQPDVKVGPHSMKGILHEEKLLYYLDLNETLPSGDKIKARLRFESDGKQLDFEEDIKKASSGHSWNLVQASAEVSGFIHISAKGEKEHDILFQGTGYHDHNTGNEPMRDEFDDWYWGRLHFENATLVYYVMNSCGDQQRRAWLIDNDLNIIDTFDSIKLIDRGFSLFGLKYAHKINMHSASAGIQIQQSSVLDSGPFYLRFMSDGFLQLQGQDLPEKSQGITEYIHPDRIYFRIFWPLVSMRIRQSGERPHWVQRSKRLYRWTW